MVEIGPAGGFTEEEIEDIVGAMAEAGYGLEYDDSAGLIARTRRGPNPFDAAQTFEESELTLTLTTAQIKGGSVAIGFMRGSSVTVSMSNTETVSKRRGYVVNPNNDFDGFAGQLGSDVDATEVRITDGSGTVLGTSPVDSDGSFEVTASQTLISGNRYYVVADAEGASYTSRDDLSSYPQTSTDFDVVDGVNGSSEEGAEYYNIAELEAISHANSGSAVLEWARPTDIYEWDVATFTSSPDGETVDVYVAVDDGSGWTLTNNAEPISRNYSLADDSNIDPDDQVRVEAELSREDTSNNPTLDSAYRSWVV